MRISQLAVTYAASLFAFLALDFVWLGAIARGFYRDQMGHLMRTDVRWLPAFAFYALFVGAILVFVVLPAVERGSLARAAAMGAFFGLVTYATYDLTNLAVLEGFRTQLALVDMVWGTVLCTLVSIAGYLVASRLVA
ncbi:MAG: DUF2177 family protein [Gemmatimonadetes bacterium]|nr:DUF2177 family protein [Gemmatimonadota bacterium]